jgi:hypothetical protein
VATTGVEEPRRTRIPGQDSPAPDVVPFGWESDPADRSETAGEDEAFFRFPAADDPAPGARRLLVMSVYASLLGLGGVGIGIRGLVSQIGGGVPEWYVPALAVLGMVSVALSVGAFLSIHRRVLPWLLLLGAAAPLAADFLLAVSY